MEISEDGPAYESTSNYNKISTNDMKLGRYTNISHNSSCCNCGRTCAHGIRRGARRRRRRYACKLSRHGAKQKRCKSDAHGGPVSSNYDGACGVATNMSSNPPSPALSQVEPPAFNLNLGLLGFFGITFNAFKTFRHPSTATLTAVWSN